MEEQVKLNLYEKLAKIRKTVEVMQKTKAVNAGNMRYKYVSDEDILAKVSVGLEKYGLTLFPKIAPQTLRVVPYHYEDTKTTKGGDIYDKKSNEVLVYADTEWEWINNECPDERFTVPWSMVGQQSDSSKALGSAISYSRRYFLMGFFNIATPENNVDAFRGKQQETEEAEEALIVKSIVDKIDLLRKEYTAKNPDGASVLEKTLKDNIVINGKASANYLKLKDAVMAAKVLKIMDVLVNGEKSITEEEIN